jgi:hypothetical protein
MQDTFPTSRSTGTGTDTDRHAAAFATETSPSAGWRETAVAFHARDAHAVQDHPTADADPMEDLLMESTEREHERKGEPEGAI